jgi:hypothetical protein
MKLPWSKDFTIYNNEEFGISFQYPSDWIALHEPVRREITIMYSQLFSVENLTVNEKIYFETVPTAVFCALSSNISGYILGNHYLSLSNYEFPNPISTEELEELSDKSIRLFGGTVENTKVMISNNEARKSVMKIHEGRFKGEYTTVDFSRGNDLISIQIKTKQAGSPYVNNIVESLKITPQS